MKKYFQLTTRRVYYYIVFFFLTVMIIAFGKKYYDHTIRNSKARAYDSISSLAEIKLKEIIKWKDEKLSEAEFYFRNKHFKELINSIYKNPNQQSYRQELTEWLSGLINSSDYTNAILILKPRKYIYFFGKDSLNGKDLEFYRKSMEQREIILTNFRKSISRRITMDFFIPIILSGEPFAVLMLRIDPHKSLFPAIRTRHLPSNSAESFIFQKAKDSILVLSQLRHMKNMPLEYKISLEDTTQLAVKAVLGARGVYEGIDHRGVEVLADIEKVTGTPWYIVSKIDLKEIYQPLREQTAYIIEVFLLLIVISGVVVFVFWKNENIKYVNQRLRLEQERNVLKENLDYLVHYANDIIIIMDSEGGIQDANEKAISVYGYEPEEILLLTVNDLRAPEYRTELKKIVHDVKEKGGLIYETVHQNKKGERFPVEVSSKVIEFEGKPHLQHIIRDITERKKTEELLRISAVRFRQMFDVNIIGIVLSDMGGNFIDINDYYLNIIGYSRDEFQIRHMSWKEITPLEFLPRDYDAIDQLRLTGTCRPYEKQYIKKSGERIWVLITLALLPGEEEQMVAFIQNIDERKKAEQALKESEEKFVKLFDESPVAMGLFDIADFKTIDINTAFEKLYGYGRDEIVGHPPVTQIFTQKRQQNLLTLSTFKRKPLENFELDIITKTGEEKVVSVTNVFLEINNKDCLFSISFDITGRKRAEEALKRSEEKFQKIFRDSPVPMVLMDFEKVIIDANCSAERQFGYNRAEVIGKPVPMEIFTRQDQIAELHLYDMERRTMNDFELNVRTKSGEDKIVAVTNEFVEIESRECILSVSYDITDRKSAEDAIKKSEAQFKQMAEAIPHIIYTALPDGRIDYINSRFGEYAGVDVKLYYNWEWLKLFHPDDVSAAESKIKTALKEGSAIENTNRLRKSNGEYEWFLSRIVPIKDSSGRIIRWFGSSTNIHQQHESFEEVQKLLKEVERSNKDLEQFAYVASHDLQEPLRMIKSYIQLFKLKNESYLDESSKEFLGFVSEGSERMQQLINDLLQYSRISTKKQDLETFDVNIVINEVLADLQFKIQDENAKIEVEKLPVIKGDMVQIRQLFQNLIQNAIKFRGEKDPLIRIGCEKKTGFWLFSVQDNGIGIEQKYFGRIFQIFQRLHEREKYPGTGIGLAVCKKIVDRHGGQMCLDSVPGEGTTFYFTIPIN